MQGHSEFYEFATSFWWLIFPIGWGFAGLLRVIFRHHRAEQTLALLKSYADQGKEPPPELLALLRIEPRPESRRDSSGLLIPLFVCAGVCAAFAFFGLSARGPGTPFFFVAIIMAGCVLGFGMMYLARRRDEVRRDQGQPQ